MTRIFTISIIFAVFSLLIPLSNLAFAQISSSGVPIDGKWYVGEGLQEGNFFQYELCFYEHKGCTDFELNLRVLEESENWNFEFMVIDENKVLTEQVEVDKKFLRTINPSEEFTPYADAYKYSIPWLSHFANSEKQQAFVNPSWGKVGLIGGEIIAPSALETITVPAGTFDTVLITWRSAGSISKIWVADEFPFPIKAETWLSVSLGENPIFHKYQLTSTNFGLNEPVGLTIQSNGTGGGNWNDSTTWSAGIIPTPNDKVIIKSGDTVTIPLSIYLEFLGGITIEQGGKLLIGASEKTVVYFENFDDGLDGWSESRCNRTVPSEQTCSIGQAKGLRDAGELPNSAPYWGTTQIVDKVKDSGFGSIEVRYSKSFTIVDEDDYDISAWLGTKDCGGCIISTRLYVDGGLIFEQDGVNLLKSTPSNRVFFEESSIHLTSGFHNIEIGMFSTDASNGYFRASFDDIKISREVVLTIDSVSKNGGNEHLTRPTFGVSHETFEEIIDNGFQFNNKTFRITDNHHTDFAEQTVNIGEVNSFSANVYADKGLKVQEFLFGIPDVGQAHLAELGVEVWYNIDGKIEKIQAVQKSDVIDKESLKATHEKTKCQAQDIEEKCDTTNLSMIFRETLADKIMAIKAIDNKNRYQITYLNEGIDVTGESLNPMNTMLIPSNIKGERLVQVTQTAKYSPYWVTEDGRVFEKNSFDSFKQINQTFERFQDSGNPYTRLHSEFEKLVEYEQKRATDIFDSSQLVSELPASFAYVYPESHERITDEMRLDMLEQEEIAKQILEESEVQARW